MDDRDKIITEASIKTFYIFYLKYNKQMKTIGVLPIERKKAVLKAIQNSPALYFEVIGEVKNMTRYIED